VSCLLCGAPNLDALFICDDYITRVKCRIMQCRACGAGSTVPPSEDPNTYYPTQYRRYGPIIQRILKHSYRNMARHWAAGSSCNGRVLEIGSGPGWMLEEFAALGWNAVGLEREEIAAAYQGKATVLSGGLEALPEGDQFDLVLLFQALEHMTDPLDILRSCRARMPKGGRLIISVPNFESWQARWAKSDWFHLDPPRHLFHFTPNSLAELFQKAGFKAKEFHSAAFGHDVYGWVQSWQDKIGMERHVLTCTLMHLPREGSGPAPALAAATAAVALGPATLLTAASWLAGKGALLQVEAVAE
jgi:SAM-dependent methyltransferase